MWLRALVVAVVLAGCGGREDPPAASTTRSTTGSGTTIDPAKRAAFLSAASIVKPGIAGEKDERVVTAGRNTCHALASGTPRATVVAQGVERFSVNGQRVTAEEAEKLVEATERTLC